MITGDLPLPFWPDWRFVGSLLAPPTTPFYRETTIQLSAVYSPQRTKTDSNRRALIEGSSFQDWRITTLLLMQSTLSDSNRYITGLQPVAVPVG